MKVVESPSRDLKKTFSCDPGHGIFIKAKIDAMKRLLMVKLDIGLPSYFVRA